MKKKFFYPVVLALVSFSMTPVVKALSESEVAAEKEKTGSGDPSSSKKTESTKSSPQPSDQIPPKKSMTQSFKDTARKAKDGINKGVRSTGNAITKVGAAGGNLFTKGTTAMGKKVTAMGPLKN